MSETCVPDSRARLRGGRRGVLARAVSVLAMLALLAFATAQPAPTIALGSYDYVVGQTLQLAASNLEPGGQYRIVLTPPDVGQERRPVTAPRTADEQGNLTFTTALQYSGTYRVEVVGPRLDALLNVRVRGQDGQVAPQDQQAPGTAGGQPSGAEERPTTEGEGEEPAQPDPTDEPVGEPGSPPGGQQGALPGDDPSDEPAQGPAEDEQEGPFALPEVGPDGPTGPLASQSDTNLSLQDNALVAESRTGAELWRLEFPQGSGRTAGVARLGDRVMVGHGNHLLELDVRSGRVLARHRLPAQVVATEVSGSSAAVTVQYQDGSSRRVLVGATGPAELLPFDPAPQLYTWLRQEANVADPVARLRVDPTNPWLYMAQLQSASAAPGSQADALARSALDNARTFYERAQLADAFLALPTPRRDMADLAMDAALEDFVARGYRAELLTDPALQDAYGFPLGRLLNALGRGDMERAGFWADWLYRSSAPSQTEAQEALREYSLYLQEAGQRDEASLWRERANELRGGFQVGPTLTRAATTVGRTGWYGVAALIVSIIALHVTLLAKYWRPQSLTIRRAREAGRNVSPFGARVSFMRYATPLEKIVVVLLFAAALALAALQGWATQQDEVPLDWGSGSLTSPTALAAVEALEDDRPAALFVRGYAAQSVGNRQEAEAAYRQLPDDAAALNNLAILTGDTSLLERARQLAPQNDVVLYNLNSAPNPSPLMAEYAAGEPLLVAPDPAGLSTAAAGTYLDAWASAFTNPWAALTDLDGVSMPAWLWTVLVVLFLLWAAVSIIFLLVPRPRLARNAPRTLLYHLLALLLPGTGLADEFWGVFLMVPWAIFGVDFILHYVPGGPDPTMALRTDGIALIVIYVLNLVAFIVEFGSYRRRMAALKTHDPHTAREYGMRVQAPDLV